MLLGTHRVTLFPYTTLFRSWDNELAIEAMVSLIGNVHRIGDYTNAIMRVEIVLGYLPASLKTQELFTAMLQREALDVLCVDRATQTEL